MSLDRALRGAACAVSGALLVVALATLSPFSMNWDDSVRYYLGGWVGGRMLVGGTDGERLRRTMDEGMEPLDDVGKMRLLTAETPYSPLLMASVAVWEGVRGVFGRSREDVVAWILAFHTLLWASFLALAASVACLRFRLCSLSWWALSVVLLAWALAHGNPLLPVLRAYCVLLTGVAAAILAKGQGGRWACTLLALAALAHPLQQALVLGTVAVLGWVLAKRSTRDLLCDPSLRRVAIVSVGAIILGALVCYVANPRPGTSVASLVQGGWGLHLEDNWLGNLRAFKRVTRRLGPIVIALTLYGGGWRRALLLALAFFGSLGAVACLFYSRAYPGEYVFRAGAGWSAVALALLLQNDFLRHASSLRVAWVRRCTFGLIALGILLGVRFSRDWHALQGIRGIRVPALSEFGPVERECLRLLPGPSPK